VFVVVVDKSWRSVVKLKTSVGVESPTGQRFGVEPPSTRRRNAVGSVRSVRSVEWLFCGGVTVVGDVRNLRTDEVRPLRDSVWCVLAHDLTLRR
jgi:hypothetical protein